VAAYDVRLMDLGPCLLCGNAISWVCQQRAARPDVRRDLSLCAATELPCCCQVFLALVCLVLVG